MSIVEINRSGYRSETKEIIIKKGRMTVESLTPDKPDERSVNAAEHKLYMVFSRYREDSADGFERR